MDRGADWNSGNNDALMIVSHNGMLTLVKSYTGKPRCITPIFYTLYYVICIRFGVLNETHLHLYILVP
jgi:hypothetical protein